MAPVQISEVKGNARENRTAAHSHIKGLGLRQDGTAETNSAGFVGQAAAREVRNLADLKLKKGYITGCIKEAVQS